MKRRRVGNLMALAILSVVAFRPMHPYEMAGALKGWGKESDLPIKWGSLYTVVGNLTKHGLLEEVESNRAGRRPERTVYRITAAGQDELLDWTRELLSVAEPDFPRFRTGLSIMMVLGPDEVAALLTARIAAVERRAGEARAMLERETARVPRLFLIEVEYDVAMLTAELDWMRSLAGELIDGSFPGQDGWRGFHETGEIPPEMAALAESSAQTTADGGGAHN